MTLSKRGDYVVRSALCLARAYPSGGQRKIREVVAEMGVPATFASQILADLVRAGLATSRAGKGGGYRLVRSPELVSLLEVVEAGEGPLRAERCALGAGPCRWESVCPLHETWGAATKALRETLRETTLAVLVARDVELEQGRYPTPADSHRGAPVTIEIEDWVQIELPVSAVERAVSAAEERLASCVAYGYRDAEGLRSAIDAGGLAWSTSSTPIVSLGACPPDGSEQRSFAWESGGQQGPTSRFEGRLSLHSLDAERTELRLVGRFRPPATATTDSDLAAKLSRATVRGALRHLADLLEHPRDAPARRAPAGAGIGRQG
jgi:Rrf2 family iron-sulfur cluster assembly transcriptional regulator